MKLLMLLALTVATSAAPDVSHLGYQYQIPTTSYGTPISPAVSSLVYPNRQYYHVDTRGSIPNTISPVRPSTAFQTPIREYTSFTGHSISGAGNTEISGNLGGEISASGAISSGSSGISGPLGDRISTSTGSSGTIGTTSSRITFPGNSGISGTGQTGFSSFDSRADFQQQQAEVQRHIYFYDAPEEAEEVRPRVNIPIVTPKKNVKIIFIKAPTYSAPAPVQIPVLPQNEEKTLVYVLVKKPEEQVQVDIPAPAPTKPSKPEVYFIKYKTQQDAQEAISNVQSGLAAGGIGANSVEGDQDFINSIGQDATSSGRDNGVSLTSLEGSLDERIKIGGSAEVDGGTASQSGRFKDGSVHSLSPVGGSTTAGSLEPIDVRGGALGGSGIHQLYGPPK